MTQGFRLMMLAVQHLKRVANSYHCPQKTLKLEQWLLLNICCFSIILPLNICKLNIYKSGNICFSVIHFIKILIGCENLHDLTHREYADKSARDSSKWVTMETTDSFFKTSHSVVRIHSVCCLQCISTTSVNFAMYVRLCHSFKNSWIL